MNSPVNANDKRIILAETDILQLFPLKYKWAWDLFIAANNNHWTPNEVQMAPDVADWKDEKLFPALRNRFEIVLAQLTTFDIQRGIDVAESAMRHIDAPELKMFLLRQAYEESLHTWAYQYSIENMGIDESRIYNMYRTEPSLADRVRYAQRFSDAMAVLTPSVLETTEGKRVFLTGLIFWYCIFEGIWFALNLAGPIQAMFRYYRKFSATAEQFQYILRDESLHIQFGVNLINAIKLEYPEIWSESYEKHIIDMFIECAELECAFITRACNISSPDYNISDHMEMVYWYSNMRASSIGIEQPIYPHATCPLGWINELVSAKKEKNFFETRVTEYQRGSFDRDDISGGMDVDGVM